MKNLFKLSILLAGIVSAWAVSCGESGPEGKQGDGKIVVTPETLNFPAEGGTQFIEVTGKSRSLTCEGEWIGATESGGKIIVVVGINETTANRIGSITVKNNEDIQVITVRQDAGEEPGDPSLEISLEEWLFEAEGGTQTIAVTSELAWTAIPQDDWIGIERSERSFTVTADSNVTASTRTTEIVVSNGKTEKTVEIYQESADPYMNVDYRKLAFEAGGGSQTVTVTGIVAWTATPSDTWMTIQKGEGSFTVTAGANNTDSARSGSITVDNGVSQIVIAVSQVSERSIFTSGSLWSPPFGGGIGANAWVLTLSGKMNGKDCSLEIEAYSGNDAGLNEGTYTFSMINTNGTFFSVLFEYDGKNYRYKSGSFAVARNGANYLIDLDFQLDPDNMELKTSYAGSL